LAGKLRAPWTPGSRKRWPGGRLITEGAGALPDRHEAPDISVVVPVYGNADTVDALHETVRDVLRREGLSCEFVFVDDACPAGSLPALHRVAATDPNVRVVPLRRNVGQHRAVLIGLAHARGRCAAIMDGDLQDPPEALPRMLEELRRGRAAVFAGRRGRYESAARLITSRAFKTLLHILTGVPRDAGMYVVISRPMIDHLVARREARPFVVAMIGTSGLPLSSIPIDRLRRSSGRSTYTSWMRLKAGWSAVSIALRAAIRADPR
jgi:polyisoprenyl-phosphate glycosyltransferase